MKYAIQYKHNGQLVDYCETKEQAQRSLNSYQMLEAADIDHASKIVVTYTELGGPYGYEHQEDSFVTYGGLRRCIINLIKWVKETASTFGPDARDVKDFFRHCSLYVNGVNKTQWLLNQVDKINPKVLYV